MNTPLETLRVVMPVYNEAGNVDGVVREWMSALRDLQIPFALWAINDGSLDASAGLLDRLAQEFPELLVTHQKNRGHGPTLVAAYKAALREADWVFQTDSDGELPASSFADFWQARGDADIVQGIRTDRNAPWPRRAVTGTMGLLLALLFGRGPRDGNCPFRLLRSSAFLPLAEALPLASFAPNVLLSADVARHGLRLVEFPVPFTPRQSGECSIRKWKLFRAALLSAGQLLKHRLT